MQSVPYFPRNDVTTLERSQACYIFIYIDSDRGCAIAQKVSVRPRCIVGSLCVILQNQNLQNFLPAGSSTFPLSFPVLPVVHAGLPQWTYMMSQCREAVSLIYLRLIFSSIWFLSFFLYLTLRFPLQIPTRFHLLVLRHRIWGVVRVIRAWCSL
jgi:hypothetical protein